MRRLVTSLVFAANSVGVKSEYRLSESAALSRGDALSDADASVAGVLNDAGVLLSDALNDAD